MAETVYQVFFHAHFFVPGALLYFVLFLAIAHISGGWNIVARAMDAAAPIQVSPLAFWMYVHVRVTGPCNLPPSTTFGPYYTSYLIQQHALHQPVMNVTTWMGSLPSLSPFLISFVSLFNSMIFGLWYLSFGRFSSMYTRSVLAYGGTWKR